MILSADDDPDIRRLIERVLVGAGHRVILAPDGQAALDVAFDEDLDLDLVLLDIEMPRMRGLDACRKLRDDPRTAHLPVLIVSGSLVPPYADVEAACELAWGLAAKMVGEGLARGPWRLEFPDIEQAAYDARWVARFLSAYANADLSTATALFRTAQLDGKLEQCLLMLAGSAVATIRRHAG